MQPINEFRQCEVAAIGSVRWAKLGGSNRDDTRQEPAIRPMHRCLGNLSMAAEGDCFLTTSTGSWNLKTA